MLSYNTNLKYNNKINYNSSPILVVQISDTGDSVYSINQLSLNLTSVDNAIGIDFISMSFLPITTADIGTGTDDILHIAYERKYNTNFLYNVKNKYNVRPKHVFMSETANCTAETLSISNILSLIIESSNATDIIAILVTPALLEEYGDGEDLLFLIGNIDTPADSGSGSEISTKTEYSATNYFIVTTHSILNPLGVIVIGDSRKELLPSTRDNTEEIPGMHGEFDFGSELKARYLDLHVATPDGLSPLEKEEIRRNIAMYLNPVSGTKKLIFQDDENMVYKVKYSGKIDITNHPTWHEFTIPFKMSYPFVEFKTQKTLIGNGTITNSGTFETGLIIEITGEAVDPSVKIGSETLTYSGTIQTGKKLIVDTYAQTAKIDNTNVLDKWCGIFPLLQPGNTAVTAGGNVTIKWTEKYL